MKREILRISTFLLMVGLLCSILVSPASAALSSELQTAVNEDTIVAYIPQIEGEIQTAKAQIGNISNSTVEMEGLTNNGITGIYTTILFDNSRSISDVNRNKMKWVAEGIVENHADGEIFSVYTFDTEVHELARDSVSYNDIKEKIDSIEYIDQETYLKEVLYYTLSNPDGAESLFHRFIILSDGSNDNAVGNTFNEIIKIVEDRHYAVCVVGSRYEKKLSDLENLLSIARASSSPYCMIEETDDINSIVQQMNQSIPQAIAEITIPETVKDGSLQRVKLWINTTQKEYEYVLNANMPFATIQDEEVSSEVQDEEEMISDDSTEHYDEAVSEETTDDVMLNRNSDGEETEESDGKERDVEDSTQIEENEESETVNNNDIIRYAIVGAIILLIIICLFIIARKRRMAKDDSENKSEISDDGQDGEDEDDPTLLLKKDDEEDDETILMHPDDDETFMPKTIIIRAEDGTVVLNTKCSSEISIGRKSVNTVQITGDKSVSGLHCIISCDAQGEPIIKDNNSSNGTFVNDERVVAERILEDGDTLEIGRTRYVVHIY